MLFLRMLQFAKVSTNRYTVWQHAMRALTKRELDSLLQHYDDTIAVCAAWHLYVETQRESDMSRHKGVELPQLPVSSTSAAKFSAFLEGRLRIGLPEWYVPCLSESDAHERFVSKVAAGVYVASSDRVAVSARGLALKGASAELVLPIERLRSECQRNIFGVGFASVGDIFWIAAYDSEMMSRYSLMCFERGTFVWKTEVWPELQEYSYSGDGFYHIATVATHGERVYAVGVGSAGTYVQGLTGKVENP